MADLAQELPEMGHRLALVPPDRSGSEGALQNVQSRNDPGKALSSGLVLISSKQFGRSPGGFGNSCLKWGRSTSSGSDRLIDANLLVSLPHSHAMVFGG